MSLVCDHPSTLVPAFDRKGWREDRLQDARLQQSDDPAAVAQTPRILPQPIHAQVRILINILVNTVFNEHLIKTGYLLIQYKTRDERVCFSVRKRFLSSSPFR